MNILKRGRHDLLNGEEFLLFTEKVKKRFLWLFMDAQSSALEMFANLM
jgi:hypothetical protein